jgi:hypothetical protein
VMHVCASRSDASRDAKTSKEPSMMAPTVFQIAQQSACNRSV